MGSFLDKPKTEKHNEVGEGNGLRYGVSSMQGWRLEMEDAHQAVIGLPYVDDQCKRNCRGRSFVDTLKAFSGKPPIHMKAEELSKWSYFAIFDGHAGAAVAEHCSSHLLESILQTDEFKHANVTKGIRSGFLWLDHNMRTMPELIGDKKSGSTAVCALISPKQVYIANCGDSRAVFSRDKAMFFKTEDHKPSKPAERQRILNAGGTVVVQRVNGALAVSRALGDYEYKCVDGKGPCEQLVSPEPDLYVINRVDDLDEFLILACDGVWDVMDSSDLCHFVRSRLQLTTDLKSICNQVIDTCLYEGSQDNMSIVLVTFPGAPKVSEDAVEKEKELEDNIKKAIIELIDKGIENYWDLINELKSIEIPNLPPGGGFSSKRSYVERVYRELYPDRASSINEGSSFGTMPD